MLISHLPLEYICQCYQLGQPLQFSSVFGGLLHQVFYLKTSQGEFAVKCLLDNKQLSHNLLSPLQAADVAQVMQQEQVPTIFPIKQNKQYLLYLSDYTIMVLPWVHGAILTDEQITPEHAKKIGEVVAKIHSVNLTGDFKSPEWIGMNESEWGQLFNGLAISNTPLLDKLYKEKSHLVRWSKLAQAAQYALGKDAIFSHRDLDPKNVIWSSAYSATVLDWEYGGYINPILDILIVALNWSNVLTGNIKKQHFMAVVAGFREHSATNVSCLEAEVWGGYYGYCLDWLIYNIKRLTTDSLAAQSIIQTLLALHAVEQKQDKITVWYQQG